MDVNEYIIGDRVSVDWVKGLKTRIAVITQPGEYNKEFKKPQITIEHDAHPRDWALNKATMLNFKSAWGTKTENWVGRKIRLEIQKLGRYEAVVGYPFVDPDENVV